MDLHHHHYNDSMILPSKTSNRCSFPISMNQDHHQSEDMLDHNVQESTVDAHLNSLLCSLSILKGKVNDVHSMATSSSFAGLATLIQEIIVTASSMMFNCQQIALGSSTSMVTTGDSNTLPVIYAYDQHHPQDGLQFLPSNNKVYTKESIVGHDLDNRGSRGGNTSQGQASTSFLASDETTFFWYNDSYNNNSNSNSNCVTTTATTTTTTSNKIMEDEPYDIIEIEAEELLAKYTHYCQVCGKGFKRDANLRMHMRAHGDEYKSSAALSNPLKNIKDGDVNVSDKTSTSKSGQVMSRKYSCPQEGCRWNKKHAKFQPLKSMICVKNHYKRSHCPKMYVCNRCNRKQFSVLSDLKTHEKHCGDLRWRCSCGTTFSRKDKLMGHVSLFVGHSPVGLPNGRIGNNSVGAATIS